MYKHPLIIFFTWICEMFFTTLVSINLHFDWNDFRVWSMWIVGMLLGLMQIIAHRKSFKQGWNDWYNETFKRKIK